MSIKSLLIQILVLKVIFMHVEEKFNIKKIIIEILGTILGSFVMAFGISLFLLPNQLSSGGLAGIATITYYLLNIPMGTTILILNIPLFIVAIYKVGKSFFSQGSHRHYAHEGIGNKAFVEFA